VRPRAATAHPGRRPVLDPVETSLAASRLFEHDGFDDITKDDSAASGSERAASRIVHQRDFPVARHPCFPADAG